MVTHDFSEALFLADRAAVLAAGRIEQCGRIQDIFRRPATPFVARFVGMKNLFPARFDGGRCLVGDFEIPEANGRADQGEYAGVRPEDLSVLAPDEGDGRPHLWPGRVMEVDARGILCQLSLEAGGLTFAAAVSMERVFRLGLKPGSPVLVHLPPDRWRII